MLETQKCDTKDTLCSGVSFKYLLSVQCIMSWCVLRYVGHAAFPVQTAACGIEGSQGCANALGKSDPHGFVRTVQQTGWRSDLETPEPMGRNVLTLTEPPGWECPPGLGRNLENICVNPLNRPDPTTWDPVRAEESWTSVREIRWRKLGRAKSVRNNSYWRFPSCLRALPQFLGHEQSDLWHLHFPKFHHCELNYFCKLKYMCEISY